MVATSRIIITLLAVAFDKIILASKITQEAYDSDFSSPRYGLTGSLAESVYGKQCYGDCVNYTCVVSRTGSLDPCLYTTKSIRIVHPAAKVLQKRETVCRSACITDDTVPWCIVDRYGTVDLCEPMRLNRKQPSLAVELSVDGKHPTGRTTTCSTRCKYRPSNEGNIGHSCVVRNGMNYAEWACSPNPVIMPPAIPTYNNAGSLDGLTECNLKTGLRIGVTSGDNEYSDSTNARSGIAVLDYDGAVISIMTAYKQYITYVDAKEKPLTTLGILDTADDVENKMVVYAMAIVTAESVESLHKSLLNVLGDYSLPNGFGRFQRGLSGWLIGGYKYRNIEIKMLIHRRENNTEVEAISVDLKFRHGRYRLMNSCKGLIIL